MKKNYKNPSMKVREIQGSHMLNTSEYDDTLGITPEEVSGSTEGNKYFGYDGYNKAW